jgi:nucleotide-binding universal stress UspA family protein
MKVLIGVDDSPHSRGTLEFVKQLPWPADTRMLVVTSQTSESTPYGAYEPASAVRAAGMVEQIRESQEELVSQGQEALMLRGLHAQGRVIEGDPREALLDMAQRENVDLIIVGSHGRTGIEKLLMGSVASHIVAHAQCSVLVVRRRTPGGATDGQ